MDLFDFKEVKYLERDTNTPTFFGKIDSEVGKGGQVMITLGDRNFFVDINPQDGSWKWTPPEALTDGEYSLSFMTIDTAGNLSTPTQRTLIVDTTPPAAPTLLNLYDDQGAITGSFDAGKMTDDRRPTLTGIAEKGTVVYLKEGNTVIGSAKADEKTGLWTLEPTVDLADGRHNLTLVAAETFAGKVREGKVSDEFSITIGKDGDVPSDPGGVAKIIEAIDNAGSLTGSLKSGGITDDTTPELRGSAPEGSVVRIQYRNDKGEWIDGGNAVMNGTSWSWTPNPALGAGNWEFRANAGSGWTDEFKLDIDLAPAAKTEITHAYDDFGPFTGTLGNGAITDDRTPNLHGRAESNSLVYIHYRNASGAWALLDSVTAGADGRWEYESDRLTPGTYEFQAGTSATRDSSGKPFGLKIVAPGSTIPVIEGAWDDSGMLHGKISDSYTDDQTPTLKGLAEANGLVVIEYQKVNDARIYTASVTADSNGHWSFTPPDNLNYGNWTFKAKAENGYDWSSDFILEINPNEFRTNKFNYESGITELLTGESINFLENFTMKVISGKISEHETGYSLDPILGKKELRVEDKTTFELKFKGVKDFTFDTYGIGSTMAGTNPGNFKVTYFDKNGNVIGHELVNLPTGYQNKIYTHTFSSNSGLIFGALIEVNDPGSLYIDNFHWTPGIKALPMIDSIWDNYGQYQGVVYDSYTDDRTPTLKGYSQPNNIVMVKYQLENDPAVYTATVVADSQGNWTFTPTTSLDYGNWSFNVKAQSDTAWSETKKLEISPIEFKSTSHEYNGGMPTLTAGDEFELSKNISINIIHGMVSDFTTDNNLRPNLGNHYIRVEPDTTFELKFKGVLDFSFDMSGLGSGTGGEKPGKIKATYYNINGEIIGTETIQPPGGYMYDIYRHKFSAGGQLIYNVTLETNDPGAMYIDNFSWTPGMTNNDPSTKTMSNEATVIMDLNDDVDSVISLSLKELLSTGQKDLFIDDGKTQLMVNGNQGDTVRLEDILPEGSEQNGWAEQAGTVTIAGTQYHVWSNGDAELLVQDGVKTELV
ncbi:Ig-like domain-containing protein [Pantoea dispersa]|uniref:Ig-like domain-containing protein n=1 Tax=Pantoea dispersa TaxID=59814 RepID=UPI0023A99154|nr:Ig-like domain-containing protein [Pantoea dispersa]WEA06390.1 Ig-like domain-containing protein [Pantoea dispersa]